MDSYDSYQGIIRLHNEAYELALDTVSRLNLELRSRGQLSRRPHVAIEQDMVALFLASFQTTEMKTSSGKVWIDSSKGFGELETDDYQYVYDYLTMPRTVKEIQEAVDAISKQTIGFYRHYDYRSTVNN